MLKLLLILIGSYFCILIFGDLFIIYFIVMIVIIIKWNTVTRLLCVTRVCRRHSVQIIREKYFHFLPFIFCVKSYMSDENYFYDFRVKPQCKWDIVYSRGEVWYVWEDAKWSMFLASLNKTKDLIVASWSYLLALWFLLVRC